MNKVKEWLKVVVVGTVFTLVVYVVAVAVFLAAPLVGFKAAMEDILHDR